MFELWDTRNARLVGTFENESAALDAAYRELRGGGQPDGSEPVQRPHLAVSPARSGPPPVETRRWVRLPMALRGLSLRFV